MTRTCTALAAAALWLVPVEASAQPSPDDQDGRNAQAASALEEGKALVKEGLYDAAIERFEVAFALVPAASTQFAIAEAYRAKGDNKNAVRAYKLFKRLEAEEAGLPPEDSNTPPASDVRPASADGVDPDQRDASTPRPLLPRALVKRPLLLPSGLTEVHIGAGFGFQQRENNSWAFGALSGRVQVGLGPGTLSIGGELVPYHSQPSSGTIEVPVFQRLDAAAMVRISDDTQFGVRLLGGALLDARLRAYASIAHAEHKFRSNVAALDVYGMAGYLDAANGKGGVVGAGSAVQLQLFPTAAFVMHAEVLQAWLGSAADDSQHVYSYGVDAVIATSDHLDVIPFVDASPLGETESYLLGLELDVH